MLADKKDDSYTKSWVLGSNPGSDNDLLFFPCTPLPTHGKTQRKYHASLTDLKDSFIYVNIIDIVHNLCVYLFSCCIDACILCGLKSSPQG